MTILTETTKLAKMATIVKTATNGFGTKMASQSQHAKNGRNIHSKTNNHNTQNVQNGQKDHNNQKD